MIHSRGMTHSDMTSFDRTQNRQIFLFKYGKGENMK